MAYADTNRFHRYGPFRATASVSGGHRTDDDRSISVFVLRQRCLCNGLRQQVCRWDPAISQDYDTGITGRVYRSSRLSSTTIIIIAYTLSIIVINYMWLSLVDGHAAGGLELSLSSCLGIKGSTSISKIWCLYIYIYIYIYTYII